MCLGESLEWVKKLFSPSLDKEVPDWIEFHRFLSDKISIINCGRTDLFMSIRRLLFIYLALVIITGCGFDSQSLGGNPLDDTSADSITVAPEIESDLAGWYEIYFTAPDSSGASTLRGGPDAALVEAIHQARLSVEVAIYNLDLWSLRDALLAAHRRGVAVRVVIESDKLLSAEIQELIENGIPIVDDRNAGLMHHKFVIIDRLEIWTGSMNFTTSGAYRSDNNLIRIRSTELAEDYLVEFDEMFVDRQFGSNSPTNTPHPLVTVEGTQIEVYFSPDDGTMERVIDLVHKAQDKVTFMAYSFTDDDLALAMIYKFNSGVSVFGVLDKSQALSNIGGEYDHLLENGIDVRLDGNPNSMHHKVILIDDRIVVTGSYNFSQSAKTRNDENTLIIHSSAIAEIYRREFERVWSLAQARSQ
jgi:phosphatidylserine/phosphatidylglycerophosphate/cardiolipin synthase-like enzyme